MATNMKQTEQLIIKLLRQLERKGRNIQNFLWRLMDQFDDEQLDEKNNEMKLNISKRKITLLYEQTDTNVCEVGHQILAQQQKHLSTEQCIICGNRNNNNNQNKTVPNNKQILLFLNQYPANQIAFGPHQNQKGQIKAWIQYGRDKKWPLHYAAISGDIEKIKQLSKQKHINIDQKMTDRDDDTPITLATRYGQLESVIELIKNGSNAIAPPDKASSTPYKVAVYWNHKSIVVFFKQYIKYLYNFEINNDTNLECFQCYIYDLHFNKHLINGSMTKYVYCKKCTLENVEKVAKIQANNYIIERRIIKTLKENASISVDTLCQMKDVKSLHSILKEIVVSGKAHQYWLWLLDIDNFKKINSHLTHAIADTKIQALAQILKSLELFTGGKQWRDHGYDGLIKVWAFRQGGDEFAIVCWCNAQKSSILQKLYERIRNNINDIELENIATMKHMTVSIGVCHGQQISDYEEMMKKADEAAEMVKNDGKNGIAICVPLYKKIFKNFKDI